MIASAVLLAIFATVALADAKPAVVLSSELIDMSKIDLEHPDCNSKIDYIDECGLQQGFSYRYPELEPPLNFTSLQTSCKRQSEAFKCLRAHAKCLPPVPKQIILTMVSSRQKFNKKVCSEKQNEFVTKFLNYNKCMLEKAGVERATQAELNSIITPEAIINTKFENVQDRIKQSCCSVAKSRKDFMDASSPQCSQFSSLASEIIDSYLADTVGIICPNIDTKSHYDCDKLAKLNIPKQAESKSFIKPIIMVVQAIAS